MRLRLLGLCLLLVACGDAVDPLDATIEAEMEEGGIPGLAAVAFVDGEVVWEGYYGFADIEAGRRVDERSLFPVASLSKIFTLLPLLAAEEAGRLDLDAPIDLGFAFAHPGAPEAPITTRQLLTHTGGLRDDFVALGQSLSDGDPVDLDTFAREYLAEDGAWYDAEDNFGAAPGMRHEYCNAGYAVAGRVAELAWDEDFRALSQRHAFAPFAFDGTGWLLSDLDASRLALPYSFNTARRRFTALQEQTGAHYPAGGLRASAQDLTRFVRAFLGNGVLDGARVISEHAMTEMTTPQFPELDPDQNLTLYERRVAGRRWLGHSGSTFGGSAQLLMRPEEGRAILVLTNSDAFIRARLGFTAGREAYNRIITAIDERWVHPAEL